MNITFDIPSQASKTNCLPYSAELTAYSLLCIPDGCDRSLPEDIRNKRDAAFQKLSNVKPKRLLRNSTDVIREAREKLDNR